MRSFKNIVVEHPDGDEQQELEALIEVVAVRTKHTPQQVREFFVRQAEAELAAVDLHEFLGGDSWATALLNKSKLQLIKAVLEADAQTLRRMLAVALLAVRRDIRQQVVARSEPEIVAEPLDIALIDVELGN